MTKDTLIRYWKSGIVKDNRVLDAFRAINRVLFLPVALKDQAYQDSALPIGRGQTISQPTTVVMMLDALDVRPGMKVLEIGAGSGYNAALLGYLVGPRGKVFSLEYDRELAKNAAENLKTAKMRNVTVQKKDGSKGLPEEAPFDRIIVTAAAPRIPDPLKEQLKEGGILVIPVGGPSSQTMLRIRKLKGEFLQEELGEFVFVPLRGKHGLKK